MSGLAIKDRGSYSIATLSVTVSRDEHEGNMDDGARRPRSTELGCREGEAYSLVCLYTHLVTYSYTHATPTAETREP